MACARPRVEAWGCAVCFLIIGFVNLFFSRELRFGFPSSQHATREAPPFVKSLLALDPRWPKQPREGPVRPFPTTFQGDSVGRPPRPCGTATPQTYGCGSNGRELQIRVKDNVTVL